MKKSFKKIALITMLTVLSSSMSAGNVKQGVEELSPGLRTLLSKEMLGIEKGMKDIFSYTITGKYNDIEKVAMQIHKSFILKQNITKDQVKEIKTKIPKDFIKLDKKLHNYAKELASAARKKDAVLVNFYTYKMTESCVSCHSLYVKKRFPSFTLNNKSLANTMKKAH